MTTTALDGDGFDWQPLGESWWREAGRTFGASSLQIKFACAKHRGCRNTQAAREAGYSDSDGSIKQTAYRTFRTNAVTNLLSLATAERAGVDGTVNGRESKNILSRLARGADPSIRIRAIEALAKMEDAERQARAAGGPSHDPADGAALILQASPEYGPVIVADIYFKTHSSLWGMPYLEVLAPLLARDFPDAWARYRGGEKGRSIPELDKLAGGEVVPLAEIIAKATKTTSKANGQHAGADDRAKPDLEATVHAGAEAG